MSPSHPFCPLREVPSIGPDGTEAEGARTVALRRGWRSVPRSLCWPRPKDERAGTLEVRASQAIAMTQSAAVAGQITVAVSAVRKVRPDRHGWP
jgi:hypothetical protein